MPTADELRAAATLLFGAHWQCALARRLSTGDKHVSDRTVRRWASGSSPVPAWVMERLRADLAAHKARLEEYLR